MRECLMHLNSSIPHEWFSPLTAGKLKRYAMTSTLAKPVSLAGGVAKVTSLTLQFPYAQQDP